MAYNMKGSTLYGKGNQSPVKQTKFPIPRAKRLVKQNVGNTTVDSPNADDSKFDRSEAKMRKASEILKKEGFGIGDIEEATGAGGYQPAMDWATSKEKSPKKRPAAEKPYTPPKIYKGGVRK